MTCIVGIEHNGKVIMAADSLAANAYSKCVLAEQKIFKVGKFLIGCAGSGRAAQVIKYSLKVANKKSNQTELEYMCKNFAEAARKVIYEGGVIASKDEADLVDSVILIGYMGKLYVMEGDFQILQIETSFAAIGSGENVALGAMYALQGAPIEPKKKLSIAIQAASYFVPSVGGPIHILESE